MRASGILGIRGGRNGLYFRLVAVLEGLHDQGVPHVVHEEGERVRERDTGGVAVYIERAREREREREREN